MMRLSSAGSPRSSVVSVAAVHPGDAARRPSPTRIVARRGRCPSPVGVGLPSPGTPGLHSMSHLARSLASRAAGLSTGGRGATGMPPVARPPSRTWRDPWGASVADPTAGLWYMPRGRRDAERGGAARILLGNRKCSARTASRVAVESFGPMELVRGGGRHEREHGVGSGPLALGRCGVRSDRALPGWAVAHGPEPAGDRPVRLRNCKRLRGKRSRMRRRAPRPVDQDLAPLIMSSE